MEDRIKEWVNSGFYGDYASGNGAGFAMGNGKSDGSGYGSECGCAGGYGDGDGNATGFGYNNGHGYGYGYGYGDRSGNGYSNGTGYGYDQDCDSGVKSFKGKNVYYINGVPTILDHVKDSFAKGVILKEDFTLKRCYVAKNGQFFAHGHSLKEAVGVLNKKIYQELNYDVVIQKFLRTFQIGKSYPGVIFFEWHNYLTGSCLMNQKAFEKKYGVNLNSKFNVETFIDLYKDDYGNEIINKLRDAWKKKSTNQKSRIGGIRLSLYF